MLKLIYQYYYSELHKTQIGMCQLLFLQNVLHTASFAQTKIRVFRVNVKTAPSMNRQLDFARVSVLYMYRHNNSEANPVQR